MTFREHLDFINSNKDFYLGKAVIADELDCVIEEKITDEQFEKVCDYAYDYYLNSEASPWEIVRAIVDLIQEGELNYDNLYENDEKISDKVCSYR